MKPVKSFNTKDLSKIGLATLGKLVEQVSEDDVRKVKKDVISIFRGMKR